MSKLEKVCIVCGNKKLIWPSDIKKTKNGNIFCSNACVGHWLKGKKRIFSKEWCKNLSLSRIGKKATIEARRNMAIAQTGRKHSDLTKEKLRNMRIGNKNPFFGRKHSDETLNKLRGKIPPNKGKSISEEQRIKISGKNSPHWKGGVSKDKIYRRTYSKERRHRLGISKKYQTGVSYTKEYRKMLFCNRRDRMSKAGKIEVNLIQKIYEENIKKYGTLTCYLCLQNIPFGKDNLEHKIPISRGGKNEYENLEISCQKCNFKKRNKTVEEYLFSGGY